MESAWPTVPIGELFRLKQGTYLKPAEMAAEKADAFPYPVYGANGVIGYTNRKMYSARTTLVSCRGANCGVVHYTVPGVWISNNSIACVPITEIDPTFYYYVCLNMDFGDVITGSAQPQITITNLSSKQLIKPPLPIQRQIAGILSAYDELIENSRRRIEILETMARALYREWFVHFRFPGHESVALVPSPLGEIPQGWEVKRLGEVANTFRGRSYRSLDLADQGGLPFLNLKCLDRDGGFRRSGLKRYTGEFKDAHVAKKGDIVMAVTDMTQERRIVARAALVPTLDNEIGIFSMDLVRIEPKLGFSKTFLYSFLRYSSFADEVKQHANGANVLHLSPDRITDYWFSEPPKALMSYFSNFVAPAVEEIDTLANRIENLRRTRDLLLPRLLSGQIDVDALPRLSAEGRGSSLN